MYALDILGLADNYYALALAILTDWSVDDAMSYVVYRRQPKTVVVHRRTKAENDADLKRFLDMRERGMTVDEIIRAGVPDMRWCERKRRRKML
jgi:hypothetical protein